MCTFNYRLDENVKEEFSVPGAWCALRMELDAEIRPLDMPNSLVTAIIGVDEQLLPACRKAHGLYCIAMVLRGYVAISRHGARARDVVASVTELHLHGLGSSCTGE